MPFSITSIFQISSIGPRSNSKNIFYAHYRPEEDTYVTVMLIAYDDVMPDDLKEGDYIFVTGKAAWIKIELQVSRANNFKMQYLLKILF